MNKPERIQEKEKKLIEAKWLTKDVIKHMTLENLKQYMFLVIILKIIFY